MSSVPRTNAGQPHQTQGFSRADTGATTAEAPEFRPRPPRSREAGILWTLDAAGVKIGAELQSTSFIIDECATMQRITIVVRDSLRLIWVAGFFAVALWHAAASAQGITEIIVVTGSAPPGGNGTFSNLNLPALNNAGQVAFVADLTGTSGGTIDDRGVYRGEAGPLTQIGANSTPPRRWSSQTTRLR